MIDIHSHILYDIDDGATAFWDSFSLCRDAYENGISTIVATPHFADFRKTASFIRERILKINELRQELLRHEIPIKIVAGAEVYLSDNIFSAGSLNGLTINNSRYMLCEFPLGPFNVNRATVWIDELMSRGYTPIVAHPERYLEFHRNFPVIDELLDRGVIFQVNIDSLRGKNGEAPQMMAVDMVERKIARLIATDSHDLKYRHTRLREKLDDLPEEITNEMIIECMHNVPLAILQDEEVI